MSALEPRELLMTMLAPAYVTEAVAALAPPPAALATLEGWSLTRSEPPTLSARMLFQMVSAAAWPLIRL